MHQFSFVLLVTAFTARLSANPLPDAQLGFDIAADTINFQEPTAPSEDQIDPGMNQVLDGLMKGGQMRTDPQKLRACSGNTNLCCFKNPAGSGGAELIQGREQQTCAKLENPGMDQWLSQHCGTTYYVFGCDDLKEAYLVPNNDNLLCFSDCPNQIEEGKPTPLDLQPLFQQQPSPKIPNSNQGSLTTGDPLTSFNGDEEELWNL